MALMPSSGEAAWAFFPWQWMWHPLAEGLMVKTAPVRSETWRQTSSASGAKMPSTMASASGGTTFCRRPPVRAATRGRAGERSHAAPRSGWYCPFSIWITGKPASGVKA